MKFLIEHGAAILASDPGVGKTTMTYGAFKVLRKKKVASKLLVIAPLKPCYLVWPKEAQKWKDFADLKVVVLHGKTRDEKLIADADVCVINPEGLDWLTGARKTKTAAGKVRVEVNRKRFASFGFDVLAIDELTRFKHISSGRFKVLKMVHDLFSRRWRLTGSLVANGLLDLFGQCLIIDQGRTFGQYVTHFRANYFTPSFSGFDWELKKGAKELIYERLNPLVLRQAAEDFTDLPPIVNVSHVVELPERVRDLYDTLHNEMVAGFDDNVFTIASAGAATVKLRQVANGGLYLEPDVIELLTSTIRRSAGAREWVTLHDEKTDIIESLVEELQGSPLLIAYDFKHDLDRLQKRFGKELPYIGGGVSPARFKELEAAWNRGELPILLGHPQSIAHGLNLQQHGHHIAWYALTYDLELYDQFIRRIRRTGTKAQRIFNHVIVAKDTIDEQMVGALRSKDKGQTALYDALKKMRKR